MDYKDPKFQKIALVVVIFFALMYVWYTRIYSRQSARIESRQREYQQMIINLRNVEMKSKSVEGLKAEYQEMLSKYREIETLLPEVKMVPSFLVQLHTASSLTGTKIQKIEPLPVASEAFYNIASFSVDMTGTYHDFGKFISYIANFPFIVNIKDMKINGAQELKLGSSNDDKEEEVNTIEASFVLNTYYVKAEERLQELDI